ncbi:MAG: efflux RND transporter permease subunit [Hyphomonadaceae bacterium]|nr:efflux RND transporter permease subunit [Hyphomonadaceae bacterium]
MRTLFYRLPRLTALFLLVTLFGGLGAVMSLGRQEDPTLVERYGYVVTVLPGADAQRMEALVTEPLEDALRELDEVAQIDSVSRSGVSQVSIEIVEHLSGAEVEDAWTLIRNQVEAARSEFPPGASAPYVRREYVGASTMTVALVWEGQGEPEMAVMARMANMLGDRFQNLGGTEEVGLYGQPREEIRVVVDPEALAAAGLNTITAARAIAAADAKVPAGELRAGGARLGVDIGGAFDSIARIREVPLVQGAGGTAVRVGDVADVQKGLEDPVRRLSLHNGKRAVLVSAYIQPGQRVDKWASRARDMVETFRAEAPRGITVETVFDQSNYTNARLGDLARNLLFSAGIVFVVLFLCMGWRAALVVGMALPLTVCLVLILFNVFNTPLHQMSVTGLVISLGLLIDNAIVVVDEFDQNRARGMGRPEAIDSALRHLAAPLFASTLTTALAFAPIAFMPGPAGEFIGMIGMSVIFSVTTSLLVAMTVTPAMAGWFDRKRAGEDPRARKRRWWRDGIALDVLSDGYRYTVGAVLRFPPLGIMIGLAPAFLGLYMAGQLPSQFFPQTERDQFSIEIQLSPQASIEEIIEVSQKASAYLLAKEDVLEVNLVLGEPAPRVYYNTFNITQGVEGMASGWVQTSSPEATRAMIDGIQAELRAEFPQATFLALPFEQGPPVPAPIQLLFAGDDLQTLSRLGDEARRVLTQTPGVTYTTASLQTGQPRLTLRADESAAAIAGARLTGIAEELNAELEGVIAGSVLEGVEELPVRVIARDARRSAISDLGAKTLGDGTPLTALGELTLDPDIAVITRRDGQRVNDILAFLEPYTLPAPSFADFRERLAASDFSLPPGYVEITGGEAETSADAIGNLMAIGIPLILVMAGAVTLVFNSFRMALLILVAGFLSVLMAFFGVWLFNLPLGFNAIVGALGLLGIAINGSIVVLSMLRNNPACLADDVIAQRETVVDATRHIVATTLTTMGGFVPLLVSGDAFWMPLAAAIAGGVAGSALLALYFTPAVFRIMTMKPFTRLARILTGRPSGAPQAAE